MDATVFQYGIPIKYIVHWLYHWCLQKNAKNKKRLTFGRIEIKIFSQSWSMKVQDFIFLRSFVDTLHVYTVRLIKCTLLQLDMQHTNDQHSIVVMQLQYTSVDTTWHTKQPLHDSPYTVHMYTKCMGKIRHTYCMFKAFLKVHSSACSIHVQYCSFFLYTVQSAVLYRYNCGSMNIMYVYIDLPSWPDWY